MSTATIEKDEDLIILNSDSENDDIFNFWDTINTQAVIESDTSDVIIDFWSDNSSELSIESTISEPKKEEVVSWDFDFSFDFNESKIEETSNITLEETKVELEDTKKEETLSFIDDVKVTEENDEVNQTVDFLTPSIWEIEEVKEESFLPTIETDLWDVNTILDQTIAKLTSRKDVISTQKSSKSSKITDLEAQIKKLQEEVSIYTSEIEDLDIELRKIDKNISAIEKMKSDTEISNDRQRQHNLDNIKKKK